MTHRTRKFLPYSGISDFISKKDAWIVWTVNEKGLINDFMVYESPHDDELRSQKIHGYVEQKTRGRYFDIGNVLSNWNEFTLTDLLIRFLLNYGFENREIAVESIEQLMFIKEFNSDLKAVNPVLESLKYEFYLNE